MGLYEKSGLYHSLPTILEDLTQRINEKVENVTADMLQRAWKDFDYRLDVGCVTAGAHNEYFGSFVKSILKPTFL